MNKKCQNKEGIVFAYHEKWDGEGSYIDEGTEEKLQVYETYAEERLRRPEHRRIRISLERMNRILFMVENGWQLTSRHHSQKELENVLARQHELEKETEGIEDVFLRGYIYEQLDIIAAARRSLAEDIRWDIESARKTKEIL